MDIGHAYTYIKDDPDWMKKLGIGAGLMLVGIFLFPVIFIIYGYQVEVTRRVMNGEKNPLPDWDFGTMFMEGLYLIIGRFVYGLPAILLICIGFGAFWGLSIGGAASGSEDLAAVLSGVGFLVYCIAFALFFLLMVMIAFVTPGLNIQFIRNNGELGSLFRFGEVIGIARENIGNVLWIFLAALGANILIQLVSALLSWTICIPFILGLGGYVWIQIATGHLIGQMGSSFAAPKGVWDEGLPGS